MNCNELQEITLKCDKGRRPVELMQLSVAKTMGATTIIIITIITILTIITSTWSLLLTFPELCVKTNLTVLKGWSSVCLVGRQNIGG